MLISKHDSELTTITKRLEADSNFFRGLTIACIAASYFTTKKITLLLLVLFSYLYFHYGDLSTGDLMLKNLLLYT
ncbi:hypothetical protein [Flavobacterium sp.]|uniref:hypothetical protein n=1 Tax=Flavobacterium sp. TaxID=239 RepID=UPI003264FECC